MLRLGFGRDREGDEGEMCAGSWATLPPSLDLFEM